MLSRGGGNLGENGSVAWIFEPKGVITVTAGDIDNEELSLFAIDAGAEDIKVMDDSLEIHTKPEDLEGLRKALEDRKVTIVSAEVLMVPNNVVMLDEKAALQALKLLDRLEELDDVQRVFTNADFPDEALEKYRSQG